MPPGLRRVASDIRGVLFDFDGVHPTGSFTTVRHLAAATALPEAKVRDAFAPFNDDLLLGRTTHAAVWPAICTRLGRDVEIGLLMAAFDATPLNTAMLDLAARLREECAVGIVTDNKCDRIERLVSLHRLDRLFSPIVVSADCGCGKSDPAIFRKAVHGLGVDAGEAVFIDNTPRNLIAPEALGLHTIHFDDARNDVPALAAVLRSRFGMRC